MAATSARAGPWAATKSNSVLDMQSGGHVGGIVLCGGKSTRMGSPKEWLPIGEETLLQRVVRVVSHVVSPVVVATRKNQELPPLPAGVRVVHDVVEDFGPLAGIAAGMDALRETGNWKLEAGTTRSGAEGRRDEGTEGRRDGGTEGRRGESGCWSPISARAG